LVTSWPSIKIVPALGFVSDAIIERTVDLPQPE
jgi:hypothetical protein